MSQPVVRVYQDDWWRPERQCMREFRTREHQEPSQLGQVGVGVMRRCRAKCSILHDDDRIRLICKNEVLARFAGKGRVLVLPSYGARRRHARRT